MKLYVGTSGYSYKEWKGKFYPEKISPKEMLNFYSRRLGSVEINSTFYHMPTEGVLVAWAAQVPADFVFAVKAPQVITHLRRLKNVDEETKYLFRTLSILDKKLGPMLFQFPGSFRADPPTLDAFLALIPRGVACAFEFRSQSWIDAGIPSLLKEKGFSLCVADSDEKPAGEIVKTGQWGYVRLRRSDYTDADLSSWVNRILSQAWKKAFVFFKHEEGARGPELAMRFRELAAKASRPSK